MTGKRPNAGRGGNITEFPRRTEGVGFAYLSRMKRLPIGLQDFRKIREDDYLYVDKTEQIFRLTQYGNYCFYSRPRRFGKSMTISTLHELYRGHRQLFEGLWIENHWDWTRKHPVVWLRFAVMGEQTIGLAAGIVKQLREIGTDYNLTLENDDPVGTFSELIRRLHDQAGRMVLLIDEYDKPLVDYLNDPERLEDNRRLLRAFYSVVKDSDRYLEFFFLTGVSAFSKVSLFSALNNLENISLEAVGETLTGITETEIDTYLTPYLEPFDREQLRHSTSPSS